MARNMTVINEILNCNTTEEVNSIIDDMNMALKSVRDSINSRSKMQFSVGDKVIVVEGNGKKTEGTITKINKTRAVVSVNIVAKSSEGTNEYSYTENWRVPFNIMKLKESK